MNDNKKELFSYLSDTAVKNICDKAVFATQGEQVLTNRNRENMNSLMPCTHEEADTRMFVQASDAAEYGYEKITIRTVDSDVLVIAVSAFQDLGISELWISYNKGPDLQ